MWQLKVKKNYMLENYSFHEGFSRDRGHEDFVQIVIALYKDSCKNVDVLVVSSLETKEGWIMDSVLSYHMRPRK